MDKQINGDLLTRAVADTAEMEWESSPSGKVWRKRLHLVGPSESGQVTSVVRYEPEATFPPHDHPQGEEILVLEGVFSDEHGDWPTGTYLLNPEGFRHAPFSKLGCTIFVKLRQSPGLDRAHVALDTSALAWELTECEGVSRKSLYQQSGFSDETWLERWEAGAEVADRTYPDGAEIFVIDGRYSDERGGYRRGGWQRLPAGDAHRPRTDDGCLLYIKTGGLPYLNPAEPDR